MRRLLKLNSLSKLGLGALSVLISAGILIGSAPSSSALSGNDFKPGRIIDDSLFYNGDTMSVSQIQNFLDSKMPNCDTDGQKSYSYRFRANPFRLNHADDPVVTTSRATYGQRYYQANGEVNGSRAPYTCLKDHRQDTPFKAGESGLCAPITAKTNQSAAQIIDTVASACNISEKVLIVMIQKEQGLITDDWPWGVQYTKAMGYFCPDDPNRPGWCHPDRAGFFNQTYHAALQFQRYKASPNNWNHIPFANNNILYQANRPSCGTRSVYIENYATAGLYNYTPYTPNSAALNNLYGTGDTCSAYGNRNFWRFYNDWFGNPLKPAIAVGWLNITQDTEPGEPVTAYFWLRNDSKNAIDLGSIKVVVRSENGNADFPLMSNVVVNPGQTIRYNKTRVLSEEGNYTFRIGRYANGTWHDPFLADMDPSYNLVINRQIHYQPSITISTLPTQAHANKNTTASFKIKNNSQIVSVAIGKVKVAARDSRGAGHDFRSSPELILDPGEEYTYSESRAFTKKDRYKLWITNYRSEYGWSDSFPASHASTLQRSSTLEVKDQVTVTTSSLDSNLRTGQNATVSFTVTNHGSTPIDIGRTKVAVRGPSGSNFDFSSSPKTILGPGESYEYEAVRAFTKKGKYDIWIANYREGVGWSDSFPSSENSGVKRSWSIILAN